MPKDQPPSFQFYARDFLASACVATMTSEARGGYILLLCHAWLADEPGTLPDDDEILAALSRLAERWPACRSSIRRAFAERSGVLVQNRMVEERAAQQRRYERSKKGASVTNDKRWGSIAQRQTGESQSDRSSVSPSSSSSSSVESKEKDYRRVRRANPPEREPLKFPDLYERYPRRDARRAAAKAFAAALKRHPRYKPEDLIEAARMFAKQCQDEDRDPKFIPLPATWLNQDRFREFFDEEAPDADPIDQPTSEA